MPSDRPTFDSLFPTPAGPPNLSAPARWPGITPKSVEVLKKLLKDNHERWHIFFNDEGHHNHAIHRILAVYALGADSSIIEAGYEKDSSYLRETYASPNLITAENVKEHLGDRKYWSAYLEFFSRETLELGLPGVLERYIFSREFNFPSDGEPPRMLDRFVSSLLHPLIHTGYGYEFCLPGIVAEGLAETAVHVPNFQGMITGDLFDKYTTGASATPKPESLHALTIIARLLKDERVADAKHSSPETEMNETYAKYGHVIREYVGLLDTETVDPKVVSRKFEELVWMNVAIYGTCGFKQGEAFKNDFYFMHLVTSLLFLPSLFASLQPPSQALLLRYYFTASLAAFIRRGRPNLNIKSLYESQETVYPIPGGMLPTPYEKSLPLPGADPNRIKAITPNPWLPIIETSLAHPSEHLVKLQRSLAHFNTLFGTRGPGANEGGLKGAAQELDGAELLDGSLFIRVAGLTAKSMGRVREGEANLGWDFAGFFVTK